ncbi:MAG: DUF2267 domain-containing protein [Bdellovibrionaceae bacterium]|nr:DUF2267 domain-containing protein [Pseudobdellovibrionaceae bacterium]
MANRVTYHHDATRQSNHVSVFGRTLQKSELWISEIHRELHWVDTDTVYRLLRAVLHTVRDQMSADEAAHYAARLPLLLRGTFYECWNPSGRHHRLSDREFVNAVAAKMQSSGGLNFDLERGVMVARNVVALHMAHHERSPPDEFVGERAAATNLPFDLALVCGC